MGMGECVLSVQLLQMLRVIELKYIHKNPFEV